MKYNVRNKYLPEEWSAHSLMSYNFGSFHNITMYLLGRYYLIYAKFMYGWYRSIDTDIDLVLRSFL